MARVVVAISRAVIQSCSTREMDEENIREAGNMENQYEEGQVVERDDYADNDANDDIIADIGNYDDGMTIREDPDANLDDYDN